MFTTDQVATESLTVSAQDGTYTPGTVVSIQATVKGETGAYHQKLLTYSVSGATSKDTYILPGTDQLYVGSDETATKLVVEIVYRPDETIKNTVSFTKAG